MLIFLRRTRASSQKVGKIIYLSSEVVRKRTFHHHLMIMHVLIDEVSVAYYFMEVPLSIEKYSHKVYANSRYANSVHFPFLFVRGMYLCPFVNKLMEKNYMSKASIVTVLYMSIEALGKVICKS